MEAKVIMAVSASKVSKEGTSIWVVYVSGEEDKKMYCKSAYKAMRFAFLLKKRTGLGISENCLARLAHENKMEKAAKAAAIQEVAEVIAEEHSVGKVLAGKPKAKAEQPADKPKKPRKPRSKKAQPAPAA